MFSVKKGAAATLAAFLVSGSMALGLASPASASKVACAPTTKHCVDGWLVNQTRFAYNP